MEWKGRALFYPLKGKVFDRIIFTARIIFNFSDLTTLFFIKNFTHVPNEFLCRILLSLPLQVLSPQQNPVIRGLNYKH